jgi:hypothetical protein
MDIEGWENWVIEGRSTEGEWPVVRMVEQQEQEALKMAIFRGRLRGHNTRAGPHKDHGQSKDEGKYVPCLWSVPLFVPSCHE